jgi:nucleoid DNA-binding protein
MDKDFLDAFSEVVRNQISSKNDVRLKGIGTFKRLHRSQRQQQYKDGRVVMLPPKDSIEFTPDSNWTNAN